MFIELIKGISKENHLIKYFGWGFLLVSLVMSTSLTSYAESEGIVSTELGPAVTTNAISFSTFFGGTNQERAEGIDVADDGNYCNCGWTESSSDFPTLNAYDSVFNGGTRDAFVSKFAANGSLLWSTFLGGNNNDYAEDLALGVDGSCYILGTTKSTDFPTLNAYDSTYNDGNQDLFVTKFAANGSLLWSTYMGGSDFDSAKTIGVSDDGSCYIAGSTGANFPTLNAFNDTYGGDASDGFIAKFAANGSLLWSTFLGGIGPDSVYGLDVTSNGDIFTAGDTGSEDFPVLNAFDSDQNGGGSDAFIAKFLANGSLVWSTFFGSEGYELATDIAISSDENSYIIGLTNSATFPMMNSYNDTYGGGLADLFVAKFDASGELLWSTFHGGEDIEECYTIDVSDEGNCYVTGQTFSSAFPTLNAFSNSFNGGSTDAFVSKFDSIGSLVWSTFLGGNNEDYGLALSVTAEDSCYVSGGTFSSNFPMKNAIDDTLKLEDVFITEFNDDFFGPSIRDIIHEPAKPSTNSEITISCTVTDENGIKNVSLFYQINTSSWNSKLMVPLVGSPNNYQAILDADFSVNDTIRYYIEAYDNSNVHNIATDDNESNFYVIIVLAPSKNTSSFGALTVLLAVPAIRLLTKKKRK